VDYKHDVFLSYRRGKYWPKYVNELFLPIFEHWLTDELRRDPRIYYDETSVEAGDAWPYSLAEGLAYSKVMVCLWTGQYWASEWCKMELSQMLARRKSVAGPSGPPRLILAVVLTDCEKLDSSLSDIQPFPLKEHCNPWIAPDSETKAALSDRLRRFATSVAGALEQVPAWDSSWPGLAVDEFLRLFESQTIQKSPPTLG
jgi:hypothetical protein